MRRAERARGIGGRGGGAIALAVVAICAVAGSASAATAARPEIDVRAGERAAVPAAVRTAREALARRLGPQGLVATDGVGGGIRSLGRTDGFLSSPRAGDPAAVALAYVRAHAAAFGLSAAGLNALRLVGRERSNDGVTHLTWVPVSDGIPAYDSELRVHVAADGRMLAADGPPLGPLTISSAAPRLSAAQALGVAQRDVGATMTFPAVRTRPGARRTTTFANGDRASLVAFAAPDGDRLAWRLTVAGEDPYVYDELIDADSGAVLARHSLTDFVSAAHVFFYHPGAASGGTADAVDLAADPMWLNDTNGNTRLSGHNAHAYADVNDNDAADSGEEIAASSGSDWDYALQSVAPGTGVTCAPWGTCSWDGATTGSEATNRAQATTQLFYLVNVYHDWLMQPAIGFTNASRNFEVGGTGGSDPVLAEADDSILSASSNVNNANMATPPDGQSPRMQMYLFTSPFPAVNGADDASVVFHEYTHGLSNRLIGNGNGLNARQSAAMGEGWSDWYAMDYLTDPAHDYVGDTAADGEVRVGEYATGDTLHGIRNQPLDCPVGSSAPACAGSAAAGHSGGFTLADLGHVGELNATTPSFEVHDDGEIWSETLWDIRTALGPLTARELITNAMRLSPPNPSLLDERDAILRADLALGGAHHDQLWQVFAVRGMGYGAHTPSANASHAVASFATPALLASTATTIADPAPGGDGDGVAEPGETLSVRVGLHDPGLAGLTNVHATLAALTPGVVVETASGDYGAIAAGADAQAAAPFTVSVPISTPCGSPVALTLHVTSDQGAIDLPVAIPLGAGRNVFASTDVPHAIPDNSPDTGVISTLTVPSGGRIDHLRVTLSIPHTFAGDLRVRLTSPAGTTIDLLDQPGTFGSARNGFANVTLDDAAASSIQDIPDADGPAVTGTFTPDDALAAFAGEDRAGTWTLRAIDAGPGDLGSLTSWSLDIDQRACATTGDFGAPPAPANPPPATQPTPPTTPVSGTPVSGTPPAHIARLPRAVELDRHDRLALAFDAGPAGAKGSVRLVLPGVRGRRRPIALGTARFHVAANGHVRIVVTVRGAGLMRLRRLRAATVNVTIALGGHAFRATLRLTAPSPSHRRR